MYSNLGICVSVCTAAVFIHSADIYKVPPVCSVWLGFDGTLGMGRRHTVTKIAENNISSNGYKTGGEMRNNGAPQRLESEMLLCSGLSETSSVRR